jgi:hypothetical protein
VVISVISLTFAGISMDATVGVAEEFMRAAETLALSAESTDGLMDLVNMLSLEY